MRQIDQRFDRLHEQRPALGSSTTQRTVETSEDPPTLFRLRQLGQVGLQVVHYDAVDGQQTLVSHRAPALRIAHRACAVSGSRRYCMKYGALPGGFAVPADVQLPVGDSG